MRAIALKTIALYMEGRLSRRESRLLRRPWSALESHTRTHACIPGVLRLLLSGGASFLPALPPRQCIQEDLGRGRCIPWLLVHTTRRISFLERCLLQYRCLHLKPF